MSSSSGIKLAAIVPAAGTGSRMQSEQPKQFIQVQSQPLLSHTLAAIQRSPQVQRVFVAVNPTALALYPDWPSHVETVNGGKTRAESVLAGLIEAERQGFSHALVHDAARPCLPLKVLCNVIEQGTSQDQGAIVALPVRDTLKRAHPDRATISSTVSRELLWQAQTPQVFAIKPLIAAINKMGVAHPELTDEASAMEFAGYHPHLVMGSYKNIKVTFPEDIELVSYYLNEEINHS
ncbi:2-C-methyl-D-erythritol 4-phosphate cytidylyltransferase [Idiomarina sp. UBA3162]|uniref:2-C-methyl-D-erythritol 4-phosphate cytidylyltransferase n=1 Tax=Idiomarina sp. UBA3162 TaxID=1946641 RepID=UPI000C931B50|nr:2-C-methyl-D-erythritol 4-phosphate cytidylyltransferase [Idiomarina sp. UBA3162]MAD54373.1 2-C-methyl-D-erythritol 4-phosphate cytidylyltransferase [Idiomarinaceae bacterium]|tara:strand:+ start:3002 stop:3706 length:705 start_codon:yes stop_codon:yes gene_type:complete